MKIKPFWCKLEFEDEMGIIYILFCCFDTHRYSGNKRTNQLPDISRGE